MSTNDTTQNEDTPPQTESGGGGRSVSGMEALKSYAVDNKISIILWISRALTLVFCASYLLPFFSHPASSYQKVLLSNAASSALRLHQRIPTVRFSAGFLTQLLKEDSAHYLFYSVIFMYSDPVTMILVPIFLFAFLHFASFSLNLLDIMGQNNALVARFLISLVEFQQRNILRGAAFVEIFLMPFSIFLLCMGQVSIFTPFVYHQFLCMRYSSRRNTYTRNLFYEMRVATETSINRPAVPVFLKSLVHRAMTIISGMAPPVYPS